MGRRTVQCYAYGAGNDWEAICADLDIAVQGRSYDEVRALLDVAVRSYVETACQEDEANSRRLLSRHAPFWVRARLRLGLLLYRLANGDRVERRFTAGVELPCLA